MILDSLVCGDSLELMKQLEPESIDLVVTSPPYDSLRDYDGFLFNFEGTAKELFRIVKNGGVIIWVVNDSTVNGSETLTSFKQAIYFKDVIGFKIHDTMIYYKPNNFKFPYLNRYYQQFEYIFVISKGKPKTANLLKRKNTYSGAIKNYHLNTGKKGCHDREYSSNRNKKPIHEYSNRGNVFEYKTGFNHSNKNKIAFEHPAVFPEKLAEEMIYTWSNENDIVLDIFSGSGTTCEMAYLLNRRYLGFEISSKYHEIAEKKINEIKKQKRLF